MKIVATYYPALQIAQHDPSKRLPSIAFVVKVYGVKVGGAWRVIVWWADADTLGWATPYYDHDAKAGAWTDTGTTNRQAALDLAKFVAVRLHIRHLKKPERAELLALTDTGCGKPAERIKG